AIWSGTSGAAPIVSGIAALIHSAHPQATAAQVIARLTDTAIPAGDALVYGNGLVNAVAAITRSQGAAAAEPTDLTAEWIRVHRRATPAEPTQPSEIDGPILDPIEYETIAEPDFWETLLNPTRLRNDVIPLTVFGIFGTALVLILVFGAAHFLR